MEDVLHFLEGNRYELTCMCLFVTALIMTSHDALSVRLPTGRMTYNCCHEREIARQLLLGTKPWLCQPVPTAIDGKGCLALRCRYV